MINVNNLIAGRLVKGKQSKDNVSPIDGTVISKVNYFSLMELQKVFNQTKKIKTDAVKEKYDELIALANYLQSNRDLFTRQIILDAGFTHVDAQDLVNGSIEFCRDYHKYCKQIATKDIITSFSYKHTSKKNITVTSSPYGLIAATTPRNTPLITELIIIINALWTGNTLVLRPSYGVAGTIALLIDGLLKSFNAETLAKLNIVFSNAKEFVTTSLDYAQLLHYVGSTKYLENTLVAGIKKGVKVLVDGDGCSLIVVDKMTDIIEAAKVCYDALIRCNGQICITVRTILVEQSVYKTFIAQFLQLVQKTIIRPPQLNVRSDMGPLFSPVQVEILLNVAKKYTVIQGSLTALKYGVNYVNPIVLKLKPNDRHFLRESLFGPLVGVAAFKKDGWKKWLEENPINLTDVIFSKNKKFIGEFLKTSKSPRKVVNADPTLESVYEPWGAFLPSGLNDVSHWYYKYRSYYQLVQE